MQAKDIDPAAFVAAVVKHGLRPTGWTSLDKIADELRVPRKVALAKARTMMRQGLLDGCDCGCRGDFELTPTGVERFR